MKRKLKTRAPVNDLSLAEIAWLTGDTSMIRIDSWEAFFLWELEHGFVSMHRGRAIAPGELLEKYGRLVPRSRYALLRQQADKAREFTKDGARIRFKAEQPSNIPNNLIPLGRSPER